MISNKIINLIQIERERQDNRWGTPQERRLPIGYWLAILIEEVGEVAKEIVEAGPRELLKRELVQVAAVAIAILEAMGE